jgi:hypothetical protein
MAKKPIDVYRDWLGIPETNRPLNHYQLLRLKPFEDNVATIRDRYRKMNAHVRKFATGEYAEESQDLLNELAKAMLCLTDAQRKREYDASLGRKDAREGRRRSFEEVLLANKVVDQEQLARARSFASAVGLDLHQAVLQQKLAAPDVVMLAYAESQGLPYIELDDVGIDEQLACQVPPPLARQHSCVPVMVDGGTLLMASPQPLVPDVEEELRLRFGMPVRTVLCTPASINAAITRYYPRDAVLMTAAPASGKEAAKAAASAAAAAPAPALTPEEKAKRSRFAAIIAFNVTVVGCIFWKWFTLHGRPMGFAPIFLALVLGAVVGGVTFGVMTLKK